MSGCCLINHVYIRNLRSIKLLKSMFRTNRPFPSILVPLFQSESRCETILMKMTLICMKKKLRAELIFIWKVSLLDSLWNRGTRELGNSLLRHRDVMYPRFSTHVSWVLACMLSRCMINWWELRDSLADFSQRWQGRKTRALLYTFMLCSRLLYAWTLLRLLSKKTLHSRF